MKNQLEAAAGLQFNKTELGRESIESELVKLKTLSLSNNIKTILSSLNRQTSKCTVTGSSLGSKTGMAKEINKTNETLLRSTARQTPSWAPMVPKVYLLSKYFYIKNF